MNLEELEEHRKHFLPERIPSSEFKYWRRIFNFWAQECDRLRAIQAHREERRGSWLGSTIRRLWRTCRGSTPSATCELEVPPRDTTRD